MGSGGSQAALPRLEHVGLPISRNTFSFHQTPELYEESCASLVKCHKWFIASDLTNLGYVWWGPEPKHLVHGSPEKPNDTHPCILLRRKGQLDWETGRGEQLARRHWIVARKRSSPNQNRTMIQTFFLWTPSLKSRWPSNVIRIGRGLPTYF